LLIALVGCESLQRKFTRKPKTAQERAAPVIGFLDYSGAMTPMDRYRKHLLMFDYWNDQLLEALEETSPSPKRLKHASSEALAEMTVLQGLLAEEPAVRLTLLLEERAQLDAQIQAGRVTAVSAKPLRDRLQAQTNQFERAFSSWREMEDQLRQ
jgi:hypothetical protein